MTALGKAQLGATTFFATSFPSDLCGANGLPLTPSSIKILGRFKELTTFIHPHLCRYIDLVRGKHERVVVVQEHYSNNLSLARKTGKYTKSGELLQLAYEILDGLDYLHQEAVTHRCLCPGYIQFSEKGKVKISCYGMYHMTGSGEDVPFPIGLPRYTAPEVYTEEHHQPHQIIKRRHGDSDEDQAAMALSYPASGPKVDIWSLGILLLECYLDVILWNGLTPKQVAQKLLKLFTAERHPLDIILEDHKLKLPEDVPSDVEKLLRLCLHISPLKRPSAETLLDMDIFAKQRETQSAPRNGYYIFTTELRCKDLEVIEYQGRQDKDEEEDHLAARDILEVYYLWKLAGGDIIGTLKKCGLVRSQPPVTTLSSFVVEEGEMFGTDRDRSTLLDKTVVTLSQEQLRERLANVDEATYYPLLEAEKEEHSTKQNGNSYQNQAVDLPLVIKERDVEYQFHRVVLFDRLLKAYPYKRPDILREARVDIPPHFRAHVWAALLEVEGDVQGRYRSIDKETPTPTDRQIAVDIPRCHQYDELLSSPTAHAKFKRILKAWVVSHPQYVYWQGLDSLCAPFLYLNFNDEALAYACLSAFIPKYLHKFFLKDNSPVIQEYLAVFSHLITFHDPELGNHLDGIGFIPDLYAIPWFLTMYAHVFPLHKILHLWDTMLLGNSSFPLCIGVAILRQLKDPLLSFGFNECILLFSDMPEIDIGRCVQDSIKIFCSTPKSATFRQHARPQKQTPNIETRPSKPNVSYYSQDYNDRAQSELSMEPIPLEELKMEKCPRISAEDLIDLCELAGHSPTRSPSKRTHNSKPKILVIDVRSQEEYMRGTIPGSINIPFASAFSPEGDLVPCPAVQDLNAHKAQIKVVMGSRGRNAVHFAHELVRFGYSKVCVLHKGIDGLRATGLLAVPSPDIL